MSFIFFSSPNNTYDANTFRFRTVSSTSSFIPIAHPLNYCEAQFFSGRIEARSARGEISSSRNHPFAQLGFLAVRRQSTELIRRMAKSKAPAVKSGKERRQTVAKNARVALASAIYYLIVSQFLRQISMCPLFTWMVAYDL